MIVMKKMKEVFMKRDLLVGVELKVQLEVQVQVQIQVQVQVW